MQRQPPTHLAAVRRVRVRAHPALAALHRARGDRDAVPSVRRRQPGAGATPAGGWLPVPARHHTIATAHRRAATGAGQLGPPPGNVGGRCGTGASVHSLQCQARLGAVLEGGPLYASAADGSECRVGHRGFGFVSAVAVSRSVELWSERGILNKLLVETTMILNLMYKT